MDVHTVIIARFIQKGFRPSYKEELLEIYLMMQAGDKYLMLPNDVDVSMWTKIKYWLIRCL
jgi:hypothetical protein